MKAIVKAFWDNMCEQSYHELANLFHKDAVIEWPNTNEVFNVKDFIMVNAKYPGNWKEKICHMHVCDDKIISETHVDNGTVSFYAISIFTIKDGLIVQLKEYWSENGKAPEWRQQLMKEESDS